MANFDFYMEAEDYCLDLLFGKDEFYSSSAQDELMEVEVTRGRLNSATICSIEFRNPRMPSLTRADPSSFRVFSG